MSEPTTFQRKSRRERYIVRDDVENDALMDTISGDGQVAVTEL